MPALSSGPSIRHFLLRQQVIKLYRDFFRIARRMPDSTKRTELTNWIRSDFRAYGNLDIVEQEETVKALLYSGQKMLRELKQSADLAEA